MEIIKEYPEENYDFFELSKNPKLTFEIVKMFPDEEWDWYLLSKHPNMTFEIIDKYPKKNWDWCELFSNKFLGEHTLIINKKMQYFDE